jgi:hypothetical protein
LIWLLRPRPAYTGQDQHKREQRHCSKKLHRLILRT